MRFVDAFVDSLDLAGAGFERAEPKDTGRPGYDPADLLKLYLYGYLNRVRSSRRLEAETHRNLEVIWLLRRVGRSNQLESPPPKGLLQRSRAHGISESTTTRSRPKSQASHTAKFYSGLLFTQSRTYTQRSGSSMFLNVLS